MIKINLLPRKKKVVASIGRDLSIGIVFLIVLLSAGIILFIQSKSKISKLQTHIKTVKKEIESSQVKVDEINNLKSDKKELEKKLDLIKNMKTRQKGPANLLKSISQLIPEKVWLTALSAKENHLVLEGMSLTANSIANFMKNLESTSEVNQIELDKITQASLADKKVKKFKITCNIAGLKPKQPKNKKKRKS